MREQQHEFGLISPTGEYHRRNRNFDLSAAPADFHDKIAQDVAGSEHAGPLVTGKGWVRYSNDNGEPYVQLDGNHAHALRHAIRHIEANVPAEKKVVLALSAWNNRTRPSWAGQFYSSGAGAVAHLKHILKTEHGISESAHEWAYGMISPDGKHLSGTRSSDWGSGVEKHHVSLLNDEERKIGTEKLVAKHGWVRYHSDLGKPHVQFHSKFQHALRHAIHHVETRVPESTPVQLYDSRHSGRYDEWDDKHEALQALRAKLQKYHGVTEAVAGRWTCKRCGSNYPNDSRGDHERECDAPMPEPKPRRQAAPKEHPLTKKAKAHFGTTHDPREGGYITADGHMLDLSGKNDGGDPGWRARDHREISHVTPDKLPADLDSSSPTHHMWHFMRETGAVRMSYHPDRQNQFGKADLHLNFMRKPTPAQRQTISRISRNTELMYDVVHPKTFNDVHSDDTGRASVGSMLSMVDHHLKESATPRADALILACLEEGDVLRFDQLFPMTSMANRAMQLGYAETDRVDDGRRRGIVMKHSDGHKMVIIGDRYLKSATAYHHTGGGVAHRLGRKDFSPYLSRLHGRR